MRIAVVNTSRSRVQKDYEYHIYTIKTFVEERSGGQYYVDIVDVFLSDTPSTSAGVIVNGNYDVVLFRLLYWNAGYVTKVIDEIDRAPGFLGLWGHDSFSYPEDYFKKHVVNFIVQDEPELSVYELAATVDSGGDFSKVSGVIVKDIASRRIIYGENRVVDNIDAVPSPYLEGYIEVDSSKRVYWEVSRGCLFRCDFCVEMSHLNHVRFHSFDYLRKELMLFREKAVPHIVVGSPIFNLSHQHVKKILQMIREYVPDALVELQVRPDILSKEEIDLLADMNVFLHLGIQSFDRKVLENMMTSLNVEKSESIIRYMNNYPNLSFDLDVIGGLPKTDYQHFLDDVERSFSLWPVNINVYRLSIYPGTRIYNRVREFDYRMEHQYPYRAVESPDFSKREMEKIDEIASGVDSLYNRGRLVSIFTIISNGLKMRCVDVVEKWNKWLRKQKVTIDEACSYDDLFSNIVGFFSYLCERFQKKKLLPLILDMLYHNWYYTLSLTVPDEDVVTYPYMLDLIGDETEVGVNASVYIKRFTYNVEDLVDSGFIDLKRYVSDVDKENLYGITYRLEGGVFTRTVSDEEGDLFIYLKEHGETPIIKLEKLFPILIFTPL